MAEKYDLTPIPKKKLKNMQKNLKGKGGGAYDYFKNDNYYPV